MKISPQDLLTPETVGPIVLLRAADYLYFSDEKTNKEAIDVLDTIRKEMVTLS